MNLFKLKKEKTKTLLLSVNNFNNNKLFKNKKQFYKN